MEEKVYMEIIDDFELNRRKIKSCDEFAKLNELLVELRDFMYDFSFLTFNRDMVFIRQCGVVSGNMILDSASRTLESVRYCCMNANFADAYTLLRKYRDDIFYYIYIHQVGNNTDILKFAEVGELSRDEKNIYDWIRNQQQDVYIGDIFKFIANSKKVKIAIIRYKLKDSFDDIAKKLNNYVHSNGYSYYNTSFERQATNTNLKVVCMEFEDLLTYITMSFLFILTLDNPVLIMSEDYVNYLELDDIPPDNSQYWVASFVSEFISKHKGILDEKCDEYLRNITGMYI